MAFGEFRADGFDQRAAFRRFATLLVVSDWLGVFLLSATSVPFFARLAHPFNMG